MHDLKYNDIPLFKIAIMGSAAVGKTSIINRLINNNFSVVYEPTLEVNNYTTLFNLNEYDVKTKTYVMLTLEDIFGINNPLLQTPESLVTSEIQKERRKQMTHSFQKLMFTSVDKRDKVSNEQDKKKTKNTSNKKDRNPKYIVYERLFENDDKIERQGFMFVCDCTDPKTYDDIKVIMEKIYQIEKTNNIIYPKCILLNKIDQAHDKKKLKTIISDLEGFKAKMKFEFYRVSALTNLGVQEAFRKFISKIHQQQVDQKQNEGVDDMENDEVESDQITCQDKWNSCSKKAMCGNRMFTCGEAADSEEEN